jgi:hypothetical protein
MDFYYNMHGHILESVQHAKYLGVTISTDLKWNTHIQQTAAKANKSLCFIRRNLKVQSQTIKERAYQTLIRPKLEYCCTVWDPHTNENINSLERVQRRAARYTCNRHHNTNSVSEMLNTMNWQTLQERRLRTRLIMFHKVIKYITSEPVYTTRPSRKDSYSQIQCNKDSYKFSFFCQTIKDWNKLSSDIGVLEEFANSWCLTSQTHCRCYDVCCIYTWLSDAVPFLASLCFRLCEDPKQCSSILIWVLLGFDMLVLLLFVIVLLDFF